MDIDNIYVTIILRYIRLYMLLDGLSVIQVINDIHSYLMIIR